MKLTLTKDSMSPDLAIRARRLSKVPQEAYQVFKETTPRKTGQARNRTKLIGQTISANYSYAVPLDKGHSKQAPKGMTIPTMEFVIKRLNSILRK